MFLIINCEYQGLAAENMTLLVETVCIQISVSYLLILFFFSFFLFPFVHSEHGGQRDLFEGEDAEGDEGSPCCGTWYVSLFSLSFHPLPSLLSYVYISPTCTKDAFTSTAITPKYNKPNMQRYHFLLSSFSSSSFSFSSFLILFIEKR